MGCDYYTWIETVIEWRDISGNIRSYKEKPEFEQYERHYTFASGSFDPDLEDPPRDEIEVQIESYGVKELFVSGNWVCKDAGKARILEILEKKGIALEHLVRVYKKMNGYWR